MYSFLNKTIKLRSLKAPVLAFFSGHLLIMLGLLVPLVGRLLASAHHLRLSRQVCSEARPQG